MNKVKLRGLFEKIAVSWGYPPADELVDCQTLSSLTGFDWKPDTDTTYDGHQFCTYCIRTPIYQAWVNPDLKEAVVSALNKAIYGNVHGIQDTERRVCKFKISSYSPKEGYFFIEKSSFRDNPRPGLDAKKIQAAVKKALGQAEAPPKRPKKPSRSARPRKDNG